MESFSDYFNPLPSSLYSDKNRWESTQIGRSIDVYTEDAFPDLESVEIILFNVPEYEGSENLFSENSCKIRPLFYSFHCHGLPKVADLGFFNLASSRQESFEMVQRICKYFLENKIIPFIIGGGHDLSYAIYKSYASLDRYISLTVVDSKFDIGLEGDNLSSASHLGKVISYTPNHLFHYTNLGYQSYFVSNLAVDMLQKMNFDVFRLGDLSSDIKEIEPVLRNTDFLSFDISAIKSAYAGANIYASPNGLDGEGACRIMRYAGMSDKITTIGLFEYNQNLDLNSQTAYLIAEMIWYFIDGYKIRKDELNPSMKDCIKYTVAFEDGKNEIVFYKSQLSGRWWMGVPFRKEGVNKLQNYYVACSYRDYEIANNGEVPDRWLKTLNKFL